MSDLLASIPLPGLNPAVPLRMPPVALPGAVDFGTALDDLRLPAIVPKQGGERQNVAGDGKSVPNDEDENQTGADPMLPWLPECMVTIPLVQPVTGLAPARTAPAGDGVARMPSACQIRLTPPAGAQIAPAMLEPGHSAAPQAAPAATRAPGFDLASAVSTETVASVSTEAVAPEAAEIAVTPAIEEAVVELDEPVGEAAPETTPQAEAPRARLTLSQIARAIMAQFAPFQPARPVAVTAPAVPPMLTTSIAALSRDPVPADILAAATGVSLEQQRTTVQAMSAIDQAPLDLSRDDWTGKMIERIAALRDSAEATDTRIRLAPEHLGALEVSIRREGDRIHVHFNAENPATRQMLADAAPRLAELAEARGVKLGQSSVDSGASGQQGAPHQPEPQTPNRPASASAAGGDETQTDDRIA